MAEPVKPMFSVKDCVFVDTVTIVRITEDECRAEFERWERTEEKMTNWQLERTHTGIYVNRFVQMDWKAWLASARAAGRIREG